MENGWTIISSQFSLEGIGFRFFECVHNRRGVLIARLKIQIFI
ncbi:hypothetical protein LEP1GSC038_1202 [Leptospira weilii str. 2006001855]|uniref:Uncharacterized protein n=1 Tax=Leptospira weilii str. 2006001855 TaxID=996804 RepID=M6FCK4_9LEPT|nr:hypothetical protein LEP1GSC038_1202 [Leptospira weilii str. 2006001855]EMN43137.1 hypothetical protein LEP1GSC086_0282 [Leptospira weilii str. LNT 1234]